MAGSCVPRCSQRPVQALRDDRHGGLGHRGEAQLLLAPAAAVAAVLARGLTGVLLVSVAVRLALDPKDNAYYIGSAALAAVVFDLLGTRWTIPWTIVVTVIVFWQPFVKGFTDIPHALQTTTGLTHWWFAHQETVGAIHLAWALVVVVLVFMWPHSHVQASPRNLTGTAHAPRP